MAKKLVQRLGALFSTASPSSSLFQNLEQRLVRDPQGTLLIAEPALLVQATPDLSLELFKVSLHWIWPGSSTSSDDCVLTIVAKHGKTTSSSQIRQDQEEPSLTLEKLQIVMEETLLHDSSTSRIFQKIESLRFLGMEWTNVTLSGVLSPLSTNRSSSMGASAVLFQLEQPQFSCDQVAVETDYAPTTDDHIFLASLLSILHSILIPEVQFRTTSCRLVLHLDESGKISPSRVLPALTKPVQNATLGDIVSHIYNSTEDTAVVLKKAMKEGASSSSSASATANKYPKSKGSSSLNNNVNLYATTEEGTTDAASSSSSSWTSSIKSSVTDSLAITAGCVATGASFVSPIGAAVSVAAIGVKDGVGHLANKGQQARQEQNLAEPSSYRFGDVTRGLSKSVQERKEMRAKAQEQALEEQNRQRNDDHDRYIESMTGGGGTGGSGPDTGDSSSQQERGAKLNAGRYTGVVGSSVGAGVGLVLAGPVGFLAGSVLGSRAGQRVGESSTSSPDDHQPPPPMGASRTVSSTTIPPMEASDEALVQQLEQHQQSQPQATQRPFRLGDNIRGVVTKGKQSRGDSEASSYQFGDFTRGLFSGGKR